MRRRLTRFVTASLILLVYAAWLPAADAGTLYTTYVYGARLHSTLAIVDPDEGTITDVGPMGVEVQSLAWDPHNDVLYAVGPTSEDRISENALYVVDRSDGAVTEVGPTDVGAGLAFDSSNGLLYGSVRLDWAHDALATVDPDTGVATIVSPPTQRFSSVEYLPGLGAVVGIDSISGSYGVFEPAGGSFILLGQGPTLVFGLAHDPDVDRLYALQGSTLYELDPLSGGFTVLEDLLPSRPTASLAVVPEPSASPAMASGALVLYALARRRKRRAARGARCGGPIDPSSRDGA